MPSDYNITLAFKNTDTKLLEKICNDDSQDFRGVDVYSLCIVPQKFVHLNCIFINSTNFSGDHLFLMCCEKNNHIGLAEVIKYTDIPPSFNSKASQIFSFPERFLCFMIFINHKDVNINEFPNMTSSFFESSFVGRSGTESERVLRKIVDILKEIENNPIRVRYEIQSGWHTLYKSKQSTTEFLKAYHKPGCIAEVDMSSCKYFSSPVSYNNMIKK